MLDKIAPIEAVHIKCEILIHSSLSHPNIIQFVDWFKSGQNVYIILEFAEKGSLFTYLTTHHPLPEDLIKKCLKDTCTALSYLHARGLVHRDIKPENLLFDANKNVKLCDFGYCSDGKDPGR